MALFKIVFEFGLVGAVAYFGFLFCCLLYSPAPRLLTLAVGITYLLDGIYTPFAHGLALSLLLWNSPMPLGRRAVQLAGGMAAARTRQFPGTTLGRQAGRLSMSDRAAHSWNSVLACGCHPFVTYPWSLIVLQALRPHKRARAARHCRQRN